MLKPMYDNVVIKPIKVDEMSQGGIYISNPDKQKEYAEGTVVSVGEGYRTDNKLTPLIVSVGDNIVYRKMTEIQIEDNGDELFLISEANILAIKSKGEKNEDR